MTVFSKVNKWPTSLRDASSAYNSRANGTSASPRICFCAIEGATARVNAVTFESLRMLYFVGSNASTSGYFTSDAIGSDTSPVSVGGGDLDRAE